MRRTTKLIAAVLLLAVIGVLAVLIILPRRPADLVYGGYRLSYWVRNGGMVDYRPGGPPPSPPNLTKLDSNAAPYLVGVLRRQGSPWVERYRRWYLLHWTKLPLWLTQRLGMPISIGELQAHAADMLERTGPGSRETIAALLEVAEKSDSERNEIVNVLGKIGTNNPVAIEGLCRLIEQKPNPSFSEPAIHSLGLIGGQSQAAVNFLVQRLLAGLHSGESGYLISALEHMGHQGNLGVRGLARIYRECGDWDICFSALGALQELTPEQPEAMNALVSFVRHGHKPGRDLWYEMVIASRAKDPNSAGMRAVIAVALDDQEDISDRIQACQVMDMAHEQPPSFALGQGNTNEVIAAIRARANAELQSLNNPQSPSAK